MRVRIGQDDYVDVDHVDDVNLNHDEFYVGGERITEEKAEQIAREVARRHGLKGGRPPLSAEGSERIGLRIPCGLRSRLKERAALDNVSESEVAREALERYLKPVA